MWNGVSVKAIRIQYATDGNCVRREENWVIGAKVFQMHWVAFVNKEQTFSLQHVG